MPITYDATCDEPDSPTAEEEQDAAGLAAEQEAELREAIAAALADCRGEIYLATVRRIVIEELNKQPRLAWEPQWQTRTPVPIPAMG